MPRIRATLPTLALCTSILLPLLAAGAAAAESVDLAVEESRTLPKPADLKPGTVAFSDSQGSELVDQTTGLIRFEEWAKADPVAKRYLSLYPAYTEPNIPVTVQGAPRNYLEKLHVYLASARFVVDRPASAIDLQRYAAISFLERIDPSIKHQQINAQDVTPGKDPKAAHNMLPGRGWCTGPQQVCIRSRYQLEGKLPAGVKLANQLRESAKKIPDYLEFESELRLLPASEIDDGFAELTGIATPVSGVLQQSVFHVNHVMQFGKLLAIVQPHPASPDKSVVTAMLALGVESDVLELKKDYAKYPVLRNLVPAQVLLGKSSFNVGTSLSAGLPAYARNRAKAIAQIMQRES